VISLGGSMPQPFRFAADLHGSSRAEIMAQIQKIERQGYQTIVTGEHPTGEMLGQIATLAAVAMASSKLTIASQVFANDFRNPALLARELATIDMLSEGRLEFGIGTGWARDEYLQIGMPYDSPAVRVDRFTEALAIFKQLFRGEPFSFQGKYYTFQQHTGLRSFQQPHPRQFIGGGGKRMLGLAAREADIVGLNAVMTADGQIDSASLTAGAVAEKVAWVRQQAGERFAQLELHILVLAVIITEDREQAAAQLLRDLEHEPVAHREAMGIGDLLRSPYLLFGTVDQMEATLLHNREQFGISYITVFGDGVLPFSQVVQRLVGR
jgi:probable F420-dependent oxidoreductase